jgi:hypothetical protein
MITKSGHLTGAFKNGASIRNDGRCLGPSVSSFPGTGEPLALT